MLNHINKFLMTVSKFYGFFKLYLFYLMTKLIFSSIHRSIFWESIIRFLIYIPFEANNFRKKNYEFKLISNYSV